MASWHSNRAVQPTRGSRIASRTEEIRAGQLQFRNQGNRKHRIRPCMDNKKSLGLSIPERTAAPEGSFLTDAKAVESWIAGLPMGSVGETSRQVFKTIVEFNRLELPNLPRIKVAELFRKPIGYISENLRKHYFDTAFPLSAKNQKIAVLSRELYSELAIAYKIYIEDAIAGRSGKFDQKLLVIALHRALRALSWVLYQSALIYTPPPEGTWREINRLFAYAEKNNLHEAAVKEGSDGAASSSIGELYLQILLFAICSPYRLRQREIEHVHAQLSDWGSRLTLDKVQPGKRSLTMFVVKLDAESPPVHIELQSLDINQHCRQVETANLMRFLRENFKQLPSERGTVKSHSGNGKTSKQLLRKIIQVLSHAPKRRFVRTQLRFELQNVVGLSTIHRLLSTAPPEKSPENAAADPVEDNHEIDWFYAPTGKRPLINTLLYTSESMAGYSLTPIGTPLEEESILGTDSTNPGFGSKPPDSWRGTRQPVPEPFSFKTLNESAGGYCIRWQGMDAPKIKVGEILGIQSVTDGKQFSIGISRWLKNVPGLGLQVGMELVSPRSFAVSAYLEKNARLTTPENCLLLPELEASGQPASLLTPALCFEVGDVLQLDMAGERKQVRLTRLLESTGTFAQFQFVHLDQQPRPSGTEDEHGDNDKDFDSIWSGI